MTIAISDLLDSSLNTVDPQSFVLIQRITTKNIFLMEQRKPSIAVSFILDFKHWLKTLKGHFRAYILKGKT